MDLKGFLGNLRSKAKSGRSRYKTRTISFRGTRFRVEVADTLGKVARGLMNRESLPKNEGMLFVFGREGVYGFWMLGMKFSIDIIWLDSKGCVVHIWREAKPCRSMLDCPTIRPGKKSKYVVELNAGTARRLGIRVGGRFRL